MYDGASISGAAIAETGTDTNSRNVIIPHSSFFIIVLKAIFSPTKLYTYKYVPAVSKMNVTIQNPIRKTAANTA